MEKGNENRSLAKNMMNALEQVRKMQEQNRMIRKSAREWKERAVAAEKRCRELLEERIRREDEHNEFARKIAEKLGNETKKMMQNAEELQRVNYSCEELRYELTRVKAHAYDLAFDKRLEE